MLFLLYDTNEMCFYLAFRFSFFFFFEMCWEAAKHGNTWICLYSLFSLWTRNTVAAVWIEIISLCSAVHMYRGPDTYLFQADWASHRPVRPSLDVGSLLLNIHHISTAIHWNWDAESSCKPRIRRTKGILKVCLGTMKWTVDSWLCSVYKILDDWEHRCWRREVSTSRAPMAGSNIWTRYVIVALHLCTRSGMTQVFIQRWRLFLLLKGDNYSWSFFLDTPWWWTPPFQWISQVAYCIRLALHTRQHHSSVNSVLLQWNHCDNLTADWNLPFRFVWRFLYLAPFTWLAWRSSVNLVHKTGKLNQASQRLPFIKIILVHKIHFLLWKYYKLGRKQGTIKKKKNK